MELCKQQMREGGGIEGDNGVNHIVVWLGDIVVLYVKSQNASSNNKTQMEVYFPELLNLKCRTHEIGKGYSSSPPFGEEALIIFEKINLVEQTRIGYYNLSPY